MPRFILEIELGNDAMQTGNDVANALYKIGLSGLSYRGKMIRIDPISIRDINGNTVGHYWVRE